MSSAPTSYHRSLTQAEEGEERLGTFSEVDSGGDSSLPARQHTRTLDPGWRLTIDRAGRLRLLAALQ